MIEANECILKSLLTAEKIIIRITDRFTYQDHAGPPFLKYTLLKLKETFFLRTMHSNVYINKGK